MPVRIKGGEAESMARGAGGSSCAAVSKCHGRGRGRPLLLGCQRPAPPSMARSHGPCSGLRCCHALQAASTGPPPPPPRCPCSPDRRAAAMPCRLRARGICWSLQAPRQPRPAQQTAATAWSTPTRRPTWRRRRRQQLQGAAGAAARRGRRAGLQRAWRGTACGGAATCWRATASGPRCCCRCLPGPLAGEADGRTRVAQRRGVCGRVPVPGRGWGVGGRACPVGCCALRWVPRRLQADGDCWDLPGFSCADGDCWGWCMGLLHDVSPERQAAGSGQ